jgi:hypothetical protein
MKNKADFERVITNHLFLYLCYEMQDLAKPDARLQARRQLVMHNTVHSDDLELGI